MQRTSFLHKCLLMHSAGRIRAGVDVFSQLPQPTGALKPGTKLGPDQMPTPFYRSLELLFCSCPHFCRGLNKSPTLAFRFSLLTHSFFEKIRKPAEEIYVQLLLWSRAQTSVEVNEVAVSCKRIQSVSMQKERKPGNSHCY